MTDWKSHFMFSKRQRNGIFLLLLLIVIFQGVYFFVVPRVGNSSEEIKVKNKKFELFQKEIDSLKLVEIETNKPKLYPFNPNFITDYKGYTLGMTNEEIDRLLKFRAQNNWVNSTKQFQEVTQVSDSLLNTISLYFKFPDWVTNPKQQTVSNYQDYNRPKSFNEKLDLNTATASQLQRINGVGEKLSVRIVNFRKKFEGGFIADIQLQDVYGLSPEVIERITQEFTVKTPRLFKKINLNELTLEQLVTIQHIDYRVAHNIIEQRTLREGYKSLDELLKVKDFPINKIEIIKLYLTLE